MKAWVLQSNGKIIYTEIEKPQINEDEVLVRVKAAGICGSDIPRIYKGGAYFYPLIPGHEFSGQVVETNDFNNIWLNKRVGVFPLIPCRKCEACKKKLYEMCRNYSYLGSRRNGAFAEFVAVPTKNLIELPDNVSYQDAAMLEPMAVAVHAIRKVNPSADDKIVICGLGTIGMFILMFLLEMGIKNITVISNKDFQKKTVLNMGLPENNYINCNDNKNIIDADIYFECVGKNETVSKAIECTAPSGKIMLVGNPYSDMNFDKSIYWKILRSQLTIIGAWNSSFTNDIGDDWHYVINRLSDKKISPSMVISHSLGMPELEKGLMIMRDKTEDYIKIMTMKE